MGLRPEEGEDLWARMAPQGGGGAPSGGPWASLGERGGKAWCQEWGLSHVSVRFVMELAGFVQAVVRRYGSTWSWYVSINRTAPACARPMIRLPCKIITRRLMTPFPTVH